MGLNVDFSKLNNKISKLANKANQKNIDKALDKGDIVLKRAMRNEVPKDTGELKRSIGEINRKGKGTKRTSTVGINSDDREVIERGYYQEHGTKRISGKKWMKRASKNSKDKVLEVMAKSLKEDMKDS
ncbi:HK97 gp10 family phage protein [Clostridium sp. NSJ-49]|uniref:HK97-gp10 family putative phage morphogenesis protein n=1 Tax=Clostridium sp. NSJ-49 TaxID=2763034 RepID=UPI00164C9F08|nr:HK97 gp10 family phage protein [Clostridium sp. NSJ-49]